LRTNRSSQSPSISSRNARVASLQKRLDRLRASLDLLLDESGAEMADIPGGASGLLCRDYKRKKADKLVTRIAPGVVSVVAELRAHGANSVFSQNMAKLSVAKALGTLGMGLERS
jgi:hypothetical protein